MKLSPERRRTYLAILSFFASLIVLGILVGVDGQWEFLGVLILCGGAIVAVGFLVWYLSHYIRSMTPILGKDNTIYSERCSVFIGYHQYYWFVTRILVYENELFIKSIEDIHFAPRDIWDIKPYNYGLRNGIIIKHNRGDVLRPVIILTWNSDLLQESIETGLHLSEMPHYGKEPPFEGLSEQERQERKKYPWLQ